MKFETKAIRHKLKTTEQREHSTPIFPTSSFVYDDAEQMRQLFAGEQQGNIYSRFTNPNCQEFEEKMAALEGVDRAIATASGMAANFAALLAHLQAGDHILASRALFGSTFNLISKYLPKWGIQYDWLDREQEDRWASQVKPNTKMVFVETPSNPGLEIIDLEKIGKLCKDHNLLFAVDNCFATPYLQQPAKYGADLIVHSATKFIDGQGRVLGGLVAGNEKAIEPVYLFCRNSGPSLSPFNAWILSKSLETLHVRMDRHCSNAMALAEWLSTMPQINKVNYPFLNTHPQYALAKKQMSQGGGIITFELKGGLAAGVSLMNRVKLLSLSANLGDTRTIISHPASTTHARLSEADRLSIGITPGLVRLSIGLEHVDDLKKDLTQAFVVES